MVRPINLEGVDIIRNGARERRNFLADLALAKDAQKTQRIQAETEASKERRLGNDQYRQAVALLPKAVMEAAQEASKMGEGRRLQYFRTLIEPTLSVMERSGVSEASQLRQSLGALEEGDFTPQGIAELTSGQREFNGLIDMANVTPEEAQRAARIKLRLEPGAATASPSVQMIGDVPHMFNPATETMRQIEVDGQAVTPESVASNAGTVAAGREAGKAAIEQSNEAIKALGGVRKTIAAYDDAIQAIDDGASTGAIMSRLPSMTQASIELDNARSRLGLEIIGAASFGALSEGELNLALDTAIPRGLEPAALREWMVRKRDAQLKLAQELEGAAIFLGQPGNTPAMYLEMMRESGGLTERSGNTFTSSTGIQFTVE